MSKNKSKYDKYFKIVPGRNSLAASIEDTPSLPCAYTVLDISSPFWTLASVISVEMSVTLLPRLLWLLGVGTALSEGALIVRVAS